MYDAESGELLRVRILDTFEDAGGAALRFLNGAGVDRERGELVVAARSPRGCSWPGSGRPRKPGSSEEWWR